MHIQGVKDHWFAAALLSCLLFAFTAMSLELAVQVSGQVLYRWRAFEPPIYVGGVLRAARALGVAGALGVAFAFPFAFGIAIARSWSCLRFFVAAFGGFVLVALVLVLITAAALIPYACTCIGAWA